MSYLEQHPRRRPLPDLRCVSATGEALKLELVQRWFAVTPGVTLVNAYGLTETSDDTNHEVMRRAPAGDRVPLGPRGAATSGSTSSTSTSSRCRSAPPARSSSPGCASAAATSTTRERTAPGLPHRPAPARPAALPGRRLRPLAPGRQAGVPGPPRQPGQDPRVPHRDRRDRERPAAGARRARRRRGGRRAGRPAPSTWWRSTPARRPIAAELLRGRLGESLPALHGPVDLPLAGEPAADRQRQDRQEGADRARPASSTATDRTPGSRRPRPPSGGWRPPWATVLGVAGRADRPARPLLRPRRHLAARGEAGHRAQAGGVAEGHHPPPRAGRPGRADRRPRRTTTGLPHTPEMACSFSP